MMTKNTWKNLRGHQLTGNTSALSNSVIFRVKCDENGTVIKYKACPAVYRHIQMESIESLKHCTEVKFIELVKLLLAVATTQGFTATLVDVEGAFLHAELPPHIHVWICLHNTNDLTVADRRLMKLEESLHGFRQAPNLRFQHLDKQLQKIEFSRSQFL